ncbi:MAG TPA: hypothetical protein VM142_02040 [Acidimicrobiales bacterium]|nr:hypothetical protein [Acidimicrobiales bacterium]
MTTNAAMSQEVRSDVRVGQVFLKCEVDREVRRETGDEGWGARSLAAKEKELPVPPEHLFAALDSEWQRLSCSPDSTRRLAKWADEHQALRAFVDLPALVAYVQRRQAPVASDRVLAVLALLARDDELAARTVLQALVPGLRAVAMACAWAGEPEEVDAMVVATAWERIRTYPSDARPERVAANIVLDVLKQLCRDRRRRLAEQRAELRLATSEEPPVRSGAEHLLGLLNDAVASGAMTASDASLIAATRIGGVKLRELAPASGLTVRWLRERRNRAESTLKRVSP